MTFENVRWVWMNGEVVAWEKANIHVSTHAAHHGTAIFEEIRCAETSDGPAVFRLDDHLDRLFKSAEIHGVNVPFLRNEIGSAVCQVIEANQLSSCYIRPTLFVGGGAGTDARRRSIDVSVLAFREASDGSAAEASRENLFLVHDGRIRTSVAQLSVLMGITRDTVKVIARDLGYSVEEGPLSTEEVAVAEEAFVTGAGGVKALREIDGRSIGNGEPGEVTRAVERAFNAVVAGEAPGYRKWLHYVNQCWLAGAYSALPCI